MRQEERQRIARMLEKDKEDMNPESRLAAERDFLHVAAEYFDLSDPPVLTLKKDRRGFEAAFTFHASRVKNFTTVK